MSSPTKLMMATAGVSTGPAGAPGELWIWGRGDLGSTGQHTGGAVDASSPVQVGSDTDWVSASMSSYTMHAIKSNGQLWTWGSNNEGDCGVGTSVQISSPTQVGSLTDWSVMGQGAGDTTHAIKTDGTLWVWGGQGQGHHGRDTAIGSLSSPVQVGSLTNWKEIQSAGAVIALKTDGTIWTWGDGTNGPLGNGGDPAVDFSSPVQVGSLTTWSDIATNSDAMAAIKTDGTLWTWGDGNYGAQGHGAVTDRSSPVQVGSLTDWQYITGLSQGFRAVKTDGTLWSWGRSLNGTIGDNNNISRSSPVQIGSLTVWDHAYTLGGGGFHGIVLQTDGSLFTWGRNNKGQLGRANVVNTSSPIQLGSLTTWQRVGQDGVLSWGIKKA